LIHSSEDGFPMRFVQHVHARHSVAHPLFAPLLIQLVGFVPSLKSSLG
jgi:hypothetical protein